MVHSHVLYIGGLTTAGVPKILQFQLLDKTLLPDSTFLTSYYINDFSNTIGISIDGFRPEVMPDEPIHLELPYEIDGMTVYAIGNSAFANQTNLLSVIMPGFLRTIGNFAFAGQRNLTRIEIPGWSFVWHDENIIFLNSIGEFAFFDTNLGYGGEDLFIPNSVTSIGFGAFARNNNLTSITLHFTGDGWAGTDTRFGYIFAFNIPQSLRTVNLITNVVQENAFVGATNIETLNLIWTAIIEPNVFCSLSNLRTLIMLENSWSVPSFGSQPLGWCSNLIHILVKDEEAAQEFRSIYRDIFANESGWIPYQSRIFSFSYSGSGCEEYPHIIKTPYHLSNIRHFPNRIYELGANIDLGGIEWEPIPRLYGTLDGRGQSIMNLTITGRIVAYNGQNFGLFAINSGTIMNVHLRDVDIYFIPDHAASWSNVGAFAGLNEGLIWGASSYGGRIGVHRQMSAMGGIAGENRGRIDWVSAHSKYLVGNGDMGGITGTNLHGGVLYQVRLHNSTINHFFVMNNRSIGGIVGYSLFSHLQHARVYFTNISHVGSDGTPWKTPWMGSIVGFLAYSSAWYMGGYGAVLNPGDLNAYQQSNFAQSVHVWGWCWVGNWVFLLDGFRGF
ncbi:MAG: leucine-rich repeat domain-containing protein [Firmicutes bacterium]|nr:leucine-rich repeat domain-containing protein [Bacillota bacterium]